jgi:hypothetical protein
MLGSVNSVGATFRTRVETTAVQETRIGSGTARKASAAELASPQREYMLMRWLARKVDAAAGEHEARVEGAAARLDVRGEAEDGSSIRHAWWDRRRAGAGSYCPMPRMASIEAGHRWRIFS